MKKSKLYLFVLMPIMALTMLLTFSSCDGSFIDPGMGYAGALGGEGFGIGKKAGTIIVENDSRYIDDSVTVSIRLANNSNTVLYSGFCLRNNSITFTDVPIGEYVVWVVDRNSSAYTSAPFTLKARETILFSYDGDGIDRH